MSEIVESPTAPAAVITVELDTTDASSIPQAGTVPLLLARRDLGRGPALRRAPGVHRTSLAGGEALGHSPTPEEVRAALSNDYPRLDIRLGGTYAHPWEAKDSEPMIHGWINEHGEVVPFDS